MFDDFGSHVKTSTMQLLRCCSYHLEFASFADCFHRAAICLKLIFLTVVALGAPLSRFLERTVGYINFPNECLILFVSMDDNLIQFYKITD